MILVDKHQLLTPQSTVGRKRKIVFGDECWEKRARGSWTELEYEIVLEEATMLCEEIELLLFVAVDLCHDLHCDDRRARSFSIALQEIRVVLTSFEPLTVVRIREMCHQMLNMMQYLCCVHYNDFALVDMQDQLQKCRNHFMLFICKNAAMIGL